MLQGWSVVPHVRGLLHWSGSHLTALHLVNQSLLQGFCCVYKHNSEIMTLIIMP